MAHIFQQEMFDDDDEDAVDLPTNVRPTQRVTPPPIRKEPDDILFVDVEGTQSENESPAAGTKRKAESPPHVSAPQLVSVSVPTIRSSVSEEDSNPVKLKIKVIIASLR